MKRILNMVLFPILAAMPYGAVASAQQEQAPRFRAEVTAVLVDVLVLDSEGEPAVGLTLEDFDIYEDGVLQQIGNFDVIDWSSYIAQTAPLGGQPSAPEASINTFPRRFIFVVNRQGAEFRYLILAKRALETFIVESMAEGDEAMVVDIGMSTKILQQFVASKEETLQTVRKLTPMHANLFYGTEIATRNVYDAFIGLGKGLRTFPGRKIVIFMSPELNQNNFLLSELHDTADALNQSNTTVYSIDIEGAFRARGSAATSATGASIYDVGGLFPLANETGGRYYYNVENFEPVVRDIGRENSRYYLLSYTSTNTELDGKYRELEVRVKRPELTVVARRGYFAREADEPLVAEENEEPGEKPVSEAEGALPSARASTTDTPPVPAGPTPPAEVLITNYLFPAEQGKVDVPIAVALPVDLLTTVGTQGGARNLTVRISDGSGTTLETFHQKVDPVNFFIVRNAVLEPGSYLLQITLDDPEKMIYQASTQIDVPRDFGKRFGLSSIVLIVPPPSDSQSDDTVQIHPTSTISRGEDVFLFFRAFPGSGEPSQTARINYTFYRGDQKLQSVDHPEVLALSESNESGYPVIARLPTGQFTPGSYRILVTLSDSRLGRRATGEILITVR
jgi:VWFA-related protein